MKDERFKNAGETVWVWDNHKLEAGERVLLAEIEDGTCVTLARNFKKDQRFLTQVWAYYSFTDPNQVEYEPYGAGEMPQLDWVVSKSDGVRYLVTAYDPRGDIQLRVDGNGCTNKEIFNHYTDTKGNPIGKEKR